MQITDYHAKYYAHELTKRCLSDSLEKLTTSLMDARVDLNPHQVEAALSAYKSPFSSGAILADEVGLGKTIEAGIVLSQNWAEDKRKILIVVPSSLRKQWNQELAHRDYRSTAAVQLHIFHDRIEIVSPGGLVSGVTMRNIHQISRPRNLLLFSMLHRMELVERIGSGIQRMRNAMRAYGLKPPLIKSDGDLFSVTFFRKGHHESLVRDGVLPSLQGINEGLNEGLRTLYLAITNNPGIQSKALSAVLNNRPIKTIERPIKTIERQIKALKDLNLIERPGSRKTGGYWKMEKKQTRPDRMATY